MVQITSVYSPLQTYILLYGLRLRTTLKGSPYTPLKACTKPIGPHVHLHVRNVVVCIRVCKLTPSRPKCMILKFSKPWNTVRDINTTGTEGDYTKG